MEGSAGATVDVLLLTNASKSRLALGLSFTQTEPTVPLSTEEKESLQLRVVDIALVFGMAAKLAAIIVSHVMKCGHCGPPKTNPARGEDEPSIQMVKSFEHRLMFVKDKREQNNPSTALRR